MTGCENCESCDYIHEYEAYWCREHKQPVRPDDICDDWSEKDAELYMAER